MIDYDRSGRSIVVRCSCGARDVFSSPAGADRWVVDHLAVAHPTPTAASQRVVASLQERQRRHAAPASNPQRRGRRDQD